MTLAKVKLKAESRCGNIIQYIFCVITLCFLLSQTLCSASPSPAPTPSPSFKVKILTFNIFDTSDNVNITLQQLTIPITDFNAKKSSLRLNQRAQSMRMRMQSREQIIDAAVKELFDRRNSSQQHQHQHQRIVKSVESPVNTSRHLWKIISEYIIYILMALIIEILPNALYNFQNFIAAYYHTLQHLYWWFHLKCRQMRHNTMAMDKQQQQQKQQQQKDLQSNVQIQRLPKQQPFLITASLLTGRVFVIVFLKENLSSVIEKQQQQQQQQPNHALNSVDSNRRDNENKSTRRQQLSCEGLILFLTKWLTIYSFWQRIINKNGYREENNGSGTGTGSGSGSGESSCKMNQKYAANDNVEGLQRPKNSYQHQQQQQREQQQQYIQVYESKKIESDEKAESPPSSSSSTASDSNGNGIGQHQHYCCNICQWNCEYAKGQYICCCCCSSCNCYQIQTCTCLTLHYCCCCKNFYYYHCNTCCIVHQPFRNDDTNRNRNGDRDDLMLATQEVEETTTTRRKLNKITKMQRKQRQETQYRNCKRKLQREREREQPQPQPQQQQQRQRQHESMVNTLLAFTPKEFLLLCRDRHRNYYILLKMPLNCSEMNTLTLKCKTHHAASKIYQKLCLYTNYYRHWIISLLRIILPTKRRNHNSRSCVQLNRLRFSLPTKARRSTHRYSSSSNHLMASNSNDQQMKSINLYKIFCNNRKRYRRRRRRRKRRQHINSMLELQQQQMLLQYQSCQQSQQSNNADGQCSWRHTHTQNNIIQLSKIMRYGNAFKTIIFKTTSLSRRNANANAAANVCRKENIISQGDAAKFAGLPAEMSPMSPMMPVPVERIRKHQRVRNNLVWLFIGLIWFENPQLVYARITATATATATATSQNINLTKNQQQQQQQQHHRQLGTLTPDELQQLQMHATTQSIKDRNSRNFTNTIKLQNAITADVSKGSCCVSNPMGLSPILRSRPATEKSKGVLWSYMTQIREQEDNADSDRIRLESIKRQILSKLGLTRKPNVSHPLPKQLIWDTIYRADGLGSIADVTGLFAEEMPQPHFLQMPPKYNTLDDGSSHYVFATQLINYTNDVLTNHRKTHIKSDENYSHKPTYLQDGNNDDDSMRNTNSNKATIYNHGGMLKANYHYSMASEQNYDEDDEFFGSTQEIISFAEKGDMYRQQRLLEFSPKGNETPNKRLYIRNAQIHIRIDKVKKKMPKVAATAKSQRKGRNSRKAAKLKIWIFQLVEHNYAQKGFDQVTRLCASFDVDTRNLGWQKFDLTNTTREWYMKTPMDKLKLLIDCTGCGEQYLLHLLDDPNRKRLSVTRGRERQNDGELNRHLSINQRLNDIERDVAGGYMHRNTVRGYNRTNQPDINRKSSPSSSSIKDYKQSQSNWSKFIVAKPLESDANGDGFGDDISSNRPFLVVHTDLKRSRRVRRRAVNCVGAMHGQCCKESFYVSFKALGWDDWIIAPRGYFANYCRGDCTGPFRTPDTFQTFHAHFIEEYRKMGLLNGMKPCCAPIKFSSMSLIYYGDEGIIKRDLPKMVVDECGCP